MINASLEKAPSDNNSIRKLGSKHTIELTTQTVQVDLFKDVAEKIKEETKDELTQREKTFIIWTLVQVICLIYNVVFTPIQICYFRYKLGVDNLVVMHICDYVVDFLCAVDIYFRIYPIFFDTATATSTTSNTNEPNKLLRYKDRFSFVIDVFATIPFELIGLLFNIEGDFSFALLRLNRLLRLFRLKRYDIADFLKDGETIDISFERMFYLFSFMFFCAHYFGCLFYFSALYVARTYPNTQTWPEVDGLWKIQYQYIDKDTNISSSTINITLSENATRYSNTDECVGGYMSTHIILNYNGNSHYDANNPLILCFLVNLLTRYWRSQYWAIITMVTIGLGDIVPISSIEIVICIVSLYVGMNITAAAVGNLTIFIQKADVKANSFQKELDQVNEYLQYRELSKEVRLKIREFLTYTWNAAYVDPDMSTLIAKLPTTTQTNILYYDSIKLLQKKRLPLDFIYQLVPVLEKTFYSPNDTVCQEDHVCEKAYLLYEGVANLYIHDLAIRRLLVGDFFGHDVFLTSKTEGIIFDNEQKVDSIVDNNNDNEEKSDENKIDNGSKIVKWNYTIRAKTYCYFFTINMETYKKQVWNNLSDNVKNAVEKVIEHGSTEFSNYNRQASMTSVTLRSFQTQENKTFSPDSTFRNVWAIFSFVGIAYNAFSVPLGLAFIFDDRWKGISALSVMIDIFFIVEIYLNLYVFQIWDKKTGLITSDSNYLRARYMSEGSFYVDFISALPLDFFALIPLYPGVNTLPLFRLNKVVRLSHLYEYFTWVEKFFINYRGYLSTPARRFTRLYYVLILACHYLACGFLLVANWESFNNRSTVTWIVKDANDPNRLIDPNSKNGMVGYLRAVYFTLVGASTVGYGDIVPITLAETVYVTVTMLFAGLLKPAIVGGLASLIFSLFLEQRTKKIKSRRISSGKSVHNKDAKHLVDEEKFIARLSPSLALAVLEQNIGKIVREIPFLSNCSENFMENLLSSFHPEYFLPDERIISYGDEGDRMYVIKRGEVNVMSEDLSVTYIILKSGTYFGETAMLNGTVRNANVIAASYCDCFSISRDRFEVAGENSDDYRGKEAVTTKLREIWEAKGGQNRKVEERRLSLTHVNVEDGKSDIPVALKKLPADLDSGDCDIIDIDTTTTESKTITNFTGIQSRLTSITFFCIIFNVITIPLYMAFAFSYHMFYICWATDVVLITIYCIMYFYNDTHMKKLDLLEFISLIPFDIIIFLVILGIDPQNPNISFYIALGRLNKLFLAKKLRIHRVLYLPFLFSMIVWVGHVAACIFFFIARFQHGFDRHDACSSFKSNNSTCEWKGTWIELQMVDELLPWVGTDIFTYYVRAINWAIPTLVVVVIGDATPVTVTETFYVSCIILFGLTINALIIGSIVPLVNTRDSKNGVVARAPKQSTFLFNFIMRYYAFAFVLRLAIDTELWTFSIDWLLDVIFISIFYFQKKLGFDKPSFCNVLCLIPIDVVFMIVFLIINNASSLSLNIPFWINVVRMPKLYFLMDKRFQLKSSSRFSIVQLMITLFMLNHMLACGWIIIHRYFEYNFSDTWAIRAGVSVFNSDTMKHNVYNSAWDIYFSAFYFTIVVISTCGYGDIRPVNNLETIYNVVNALIGSITLGVFVGEFVSFFEYLDTRKDNVEKYRKHKLKKYMINKGLSVHQQSMIMKINTSHT
jgi:hypothetical protein